MHSEDKTRPGYFDRIAGTKTEDYLRIYDSTKWTADVNHTYRNIVNTLYDVLRAEEIHIHLLDSDANSFSRRASRPGALDFGDNNMSSWDLSLGRSRLLISDRKPQVLDFANPHPDDALPYDEQRYGVTFPLMTSEAVLGICTATYYQRMDWDEDDMDYFSIIGFIIGAAIARLRTTERVIELAVLNERKRLGAEIHDNIVQFIHAMSLNAASALASYEEGDMDSLASDLDRLEDSCKRTIKVFRDEMLSLRAPLACKRLSGLTESIQKVLDNYESNWGIETLFEVDAQHDPLVVSTNTSLQLMRILNEALSNVLRHSEATMVKVRLVEDDAHLVLSVEDNGKGFDVNGVTGDHWGVKIMNERAEAILATFRISSVPSEGTRIVIDVPSRLGFEIKAEDAAVETGEDSPDSENIRFR